MKTTRILACLIVLTSSMAAAQEPPAKEGGDEAAPEAKTWVTEHSARIGGRNIEYTVTAGTMLMKNAEGKPHALMGFTAYAKKGSDPRTRPIMFAYNGGPGSASLWLHMGVLGPQRAVVEDTSQGSKGPFRRVENAYSIIDETDLIMIDPVGTGFAKPVGEGKGEDFWGVDQDIKSVSEFIV